MTRKLRSPGGVGRAGIASVLALLAIAEENEVLGVRFAKGTSIRAPAQGAWWFVSVFPGETIPTDDLSQVLPRMVGDDR